MKENLREANISRGATKSAEKKPGIGFGAGGIEEQSEGAPPSTATCLLN